MFQERFGPQSTCEEVQQNTVGPQGQAEANPFVKFSYKEEDFIGPADYSAGK